MEPSRNSRPHARISVILFVLGMILILDELRLFGIPFGGFLGDWSALHITPFHHWMLGVFLVVLSLILSQRKRHVEA